MMERFVTVDYDECRPETYRGILVIEGDEQTRINSGDFMRDYIHVCDEYTPFLESSTIFNYMQDVMIIIIIMIITFMIMIMAKINFYPY